MLAENIKDVFVIDASFVLAYLLPDEENPDVDLLFRKYAHKAVKFVSTRLLAFEVPNSLIMAARRKRIPLKLASQLLSRFVRFRISLAEVDEQGTFQLAHQERLSFYDAAYLELSSSLKLSLLTFDAKLRKLNPTKS